MYHFIPYPCVLSSKYDNHSLRVYCECSYLGLALMAFGNVHYCDLNVPANHKKWHIFIVDAKSWKGDMLGQMNKSLTQDWLDDITFSAISPVHFDKAHRHTHCTWTKKSLVKEMPFVQFFKCLKLVCMNLRMCPSAINFLLAISICNLSLVSVLAIFFFNILM